MSSSRVDPWSRPDFEKSARRARDYRVIYLDSPVVTPQFDVMRHGFPRASMDDLRLRGIDNADWLRGWTKDAWGTKLGSVPGIDLDQLKRCRYGVVVEAECDDPSDLTQLQIGAAVCKAFAEMDAVAVLDVIGDRWWSPQALRTLLPDRPFAIEEHITVTGESNERKPGSGHLCHTRGMRKFARPELFLRGIDLAEFNAAAQLLNELGDRMATGKNYGPRNVVIIHPTEDSTLPPVAFIEHADDSGNPAPSHGLGSQMFNSGTLEVVDYDEAKKGPSAQGAKGVLAAIRELTS